MTTKLSDAQKHLLKLVANGQRCSTDGWEPVSKLVFPLLQTMPQTLIELQCVGDEGKGRVRLTAEGQEVFEAMAWL